MKAKRVDCMNCEKFEAEDAGKKFKYKCDLGKRVMMRVPTVPYSFADYLFPRYCNDYTKNEIVIEW
jgi:hypothetical protein